MDNLITKLNIYDEKIIEFDTRFKNIEKIIIDIHTKLCEISIDNKNQFLEIVDKNKESIDKINITIDNSNKSIEKITNTIEIVHITCDKADESVNGINNLLSIAQNPWKLIYGNNNSNIKSLPSNEK